MKMIKPYLFLLLFSVIQTACNNYIEDLALFRNEASNAHVDEYHLDDSLSAFPENQWKLFDSIGGIETDGLLLKCDTTAAPHSNKVVLFFGGQDMCLLSNVGVAKRFIQCGVDCFVIDFRGYGRSYDSFTPSEQSFYEDGTEAYRFLIDSLGYTSDAIILSGFSLGTGVAIDLASRFPQFMTVLFAAYASMDDMVETQSGGYNIPGSWFLQARFNNIDKISKISAPVCFFSGKNDCMIPSEHTMELYNRVSGPKAAYYLSGQDHNRFVPDAFSQWKPLFENFLKEMS